MECLPQDWAKTFSLLPPACQQPLAVDGDLGSSMLRYQPILPKGCNQDAPVFSVVQPNMLKSLNTANSIDPIVWIHEDGSVTRRSARIRALQQCQSVQQQQRLIPVPWAGEAQVVSAPWQPPLCSNMALPGVPKTQIAVPEVVGFTRPWHRPGVYTRQNNCNTQPRGGKKVEDECTAKENVTHQGGESTYDNKRTEITGKICIQPKKAIGETDESSEIQSITESEKSSKKETNNNVLNGGVQHIADLSNKTKTDSNTLMSCESLHSNVGNDIGHGTDVSSETSMPDPKTFAASLGLISVDVIEKPSVWLNVTLQVDTSGEIKRGQQGVLYRSLITNIVTELFYPPNLCPPEDLVADVLTATVSYDDRGRLTVLQVEFITPGIYQVHNRDDGGKSTPTGKSYTKCVTLTRLDSLETLCPSSQYLMIGDLCPVPRKIQKCHRNAQTLHKKLMEYLYTREFRKYTLPLLLEHGEEDVWSAALKAPRTRSRAAENAEPSITVFVKRRPTSPSPADAEGRQNSVLPPRRKRPRRCVESSSTSGDSVCSFPSPPPSPTCSQRVGGSSKEYTPTGAAGINHGLILPSSHCRPSSLVTSNGFQRSSSPTSSIPALFPVRVDSASSFPENICSTASSQTSKTPPSIGLSGNANDLSPIHTSSSSRPPFMPSDNTSLSNSVILNQNSSNPLPSTSGNSSPSNSGYSSPPDSRPLFQKSCNSSPSNSDNSSRSTSGNSSPSNSGYSSPPDSRPLFQKSCNSSPSNSGNSSPSDSVTLYQNSTNPSPSNSGNSSASDSVTLYLNSGNSSPSDSLPLYQNFGNSSPSDSLPLYQNSGNSSPLTSVQFNQDSGLSSSLYPASLLQDYRILSPTNDSLTFADTFFEPLDLPELCLGDELMFDFPLNLTKDRHSVPLDLSLSHSKRRTR